MISATIVLVSLAAVCVVARPVTLGVHDTLMAALPHLTKRAACTMKQTTALSSDAQQLSAGATAAQSNLTAICDCYAGYVDQASQVSCDVAAQSVTAVETACDSLMCSSCGSNNNNTLPVCTGAQNQLISAAANVLGQCVQTVAGQYGCKCYEQFYANCPQFDDCVFGASACDNVHLACTSLMCNC
mgnify:CR=1 FL=1